MLKGKIVTLRPVEEGDLETLYRLQLDVEARGEYFPRWPQSLPELRRQYEKDGFFTGERGALAMIDNETGALVGQLFFFPTLPYIQEMEIGYIVFDRAMRGKGITTEALKLMTRFLFETKMIGRIRLVIATENKASRRVAEKAGYRHEGTMRAGWFWNDCWQDGEVYAITRADLAAGAAGA
jgi:RimJ/RimL family protein N-acetyltransferase